MPDAPENWMEWMRERLNAIFPIMNIHLTTRVKKASLTLAEYIATLQMQGLDDKTIKENLYSDLASGGRIFGEFFNGIGADIRGALNNVTQSAKFGRMMPDPEDEMMWEVDSTNPCPDCLERDGKVDTFANWQIRGLPASGWSVCRENCLCNLVLVEKLAVNN